jgi:ABC-type branched-subunit amino acid transport system substrate-binding protein
VKLLSAVLAGMLAVCAGVTAADLQATAAASAAATDRLELGRRMYMDGILPTGEVMTATIQGDISISGQQVVCGACHRRSGMGASEGQEVVPMVTGDILYSPLRLPTSKPPLPPMQRPAYTDASLKRAIRDGIDAAGNEFGPLMPRYSLTDAELDILLDYLKVLDTETAPGVTAQDIHFATIVSDAVPAVTRKAHLDVMENFVNQKNTETRNESNRSRNAPWHKDPFFKSYRKWVLHVWELQGSAETWPAQLEVYYREQPVFAVLGGVAPGSWAPVHAFCEREQVPCLFPTTSLPVMNEQDFYSVYLSRGMTLEGEAIAQHLIDEHLQGKPVIQVVRDGDVAGMAAADAARHMLEGREMQVIDVPLTSAGPDAAFWRKILDKGRDAVVVLWLGESDLASFWEQLDAAGPRRLYLSTTLYSKPDQVPVAARERVYFVHPYELPGKLTVLLARSTGWLRMKRIYAPTEQQVQANAFFSLKMAGGALAQMRGYFSREYFLEQIEHMVDNAFYTSVYPRMSLAPGQRFVAKGCYIARLPGDGSGKLGAVSGWLIPGSK